MHRSRLESVAVGHDSRDGTLAADEGRLHMSMTMNDDQLKRQEETPLYIAFVWFYRIIAVYSLIYGVMYWVRLIGIYDGSLWRFDLMPVHWQLASASLAVLFPVAAIGLWMMVSWGPVIWIAAAAGEVVMHAGFPQLYGSRPLTVASHITVLLLFIIFALAWQIQRRRKKR
jgi:Family of unknown function (DUF6163)